MNHDFARMRFSISLKEFLAPGYWYMTQLYESEELNKEYRLRGVGDPDRYSQLLRHGHYIPLPRYVKAPFNGVFIGELDGDYVMSIPAKDKEQRRRFFIVPEEMEGAIQSFTFKCRNCDRDWYYAHIKPVKLKGEEKWNPYPSEFMMLGTSSNTPDYPVTRFRNGYCPECGGVLDFQFGF